FLYTGRIETHDEAYWKRWFRQHLEVEFAAITPPETNGAVPVDLWGYHARMARDVFEWLRARDFAVCHFQDTLGNGFRCFQAKRQGLAFGDTLLTCTTHGTWEWVTQ